jgi:hypothetical protein
MGMVQEEGEIFFFYRPKVERERAVSMDDVQRMYMVLNPDRSASRDHQIEIKQFHLSGKEGTMESSDDESGDGGKSSDSLARSDSKESTRRSKREDQEPTGSEGGGSKEASVDAERGSSQARPTLGREGGGYGEEVLITDLTN